MEVKEKEVMKGEERIVEILLENWVVLFLAVGIWCN